MKSIKRMAPLGLIITFFAVLFLAACAFLWVKNIKLEKENADLKSQRTYTTEQEKIVDFGNQFVDQVLKSNKEVDFDTRLKLENNVREVDDADILAQWQKFTESKNEAEAQNEVKNLLALFFVKLK